MEQLIKLCKKGNRKAQEQLFRNYSDMLYSVCLRYSRNRAEAEDNLQDSFLVIFKKIDQYRFRGAFEGWLRRVTVNTILQKYRKQGVFEIITPELEEMPAEVTIEDQGFSLDYLLQIVQELPDRYRLTFSLYVLDGYSHKEIASMLRISEGTSKSNLSRAKIALRKRIEGDHYQNSVNSLEG
nr:RNA polymerase sigma factor [Robertkochia sp. 3YJGBD-33]